MSEVTVIHGSVFDFDPVNARWLQAHLTDPPYSPHVHANITSAGTMGEGSRGWHRQELEFEPLTPELRTHLAKISARTQGWVGIYSDHEGSHAWREALEAEYAEYIRTELAELEDAISLEEAEALADAGVLPWERWSQPQKSGDRPTQGFEVVTLAWGRRGSRKVWNGPGSLTALRHKALRGEDKHRTEKPLDQALDLVSWFSNAWHLPWGTHNAFKDDSATDLVVVPAASVDGRLFVSVPAQSAALPVLDSCGGAATIATACALLDRPCLSFEALAKWADIGAKRVEDALAGKLSERDRERAERYVHATIAEASTVPFPKKEDGSDVKTWERAQRRLADAVVVANKLGLDV